MNCRSLPLPPESRLGALSNRHAGEDKEIIAMKINASDEGSGVQE